MNGERMDAALELIRQCSVDHAVAFEPGLSPERLRYNIKTEVRLAARAMSGMALVQMGFVLDVQALRGESRNQLGRYDVLHSHFRPDPEKYSTVAGTLKIERLTEALFDPAVVPVPDQARPPSIATNTIAIVASAIRQRRLAAFCRQGNCPLSIRRNPIEFLFE